MRKPIVISSPASPLHLVLLFHGVGGNAENMVPLGQMIAEAQRHAAVISVPSPDVSDMGQGYQWFSVRAVTEDNRVQRVADTMPRFVGAIETLRQARGLSVAQTSLIGFSQGGIMALESSQVAVPPAGSILTIAGRFAQLPERAPSATALHLIHGESDPVIAPGFSITAAERLKALGADVTIDLIASLGHGINNKATAKLLSHLADDIARAPG